MATKEQRRRVYYSWTVFKELRFNMDKIAGLFQKHQVKLEMFLGIHDKIITEKNMNMLLHKLNQYDVHLLEAGHSNLIKAVVEFLKKKKK
jgi:surfactin synthase thioesterase subunit